MWKTKERRNEYDRQYRIDHPEKSKLWSKKRHLKKAYGITMNDYDNMLRQQLSGCSICGETGKLLGIDHDHQTGKVRELLCNKCNRALGFFNDDTVLLTNAIKYLNKHDKSN
jgi:hypothetical protein